MTGGRLRASDIIQPLEHRHSQGKHSIDIHQYIWARQLCSQLTGASVYYGLFIYCMHIDRNLKCVVFFLVLLLGC